MMKNMLFKTTLVVFYLGIHVMTAAQTIQSADSTKKADTVFGRQNLNEVVVRARKNAYEQKMDKVVMSVQSSITASGGSVLDFLQKSPGVNVNRQNNSISMNGKTGVRIMMNGKMLELPADAAIQMLEGLSAANVDKIELINTPPAKYDADGSGGIIHIISRRNADAGTRASLGLNYGYRARKVFGGNFNISHRGAASAYYVEYSAVTNHNTHRSDISRRSHNGAVTTFINDRSVRPNITNQQNLLAGAEWRPDRTALITASVSAYRRNWKLDAVNEDASEIVTGRADTAAIRVHESNIWQSATGGVGLQKSFGDHSTFNVNADYLYYHNDNPSQYTNLADNSIIDLQKKTPIRMVIGKADYQYNSKSLTVDAGVKGVSSSLDNNVIVQNKTGATSVIDSFFTSFSTLRENIGAGYVSAQIPVLREWQINAGIRYEYTHTSITSPDRKNMQNRNFGYWFPSLSVRKQLNKRADLQFAYSRRITRPTYNDIAPYVFFWGPKTFSSGNTALLPAITDGIKIGFQLKRWSASIDAAHTAHEMVSYQPSIDSSSGNLTYRSENLKYLNMFSISNSYLLNVARWWKVQGTMINQYQFLQTAHLNKNIHRSLHNVNLNIVNTVTLPASFSLEVSGVFQSKSLSGLSTFRSRGSLNAGVQKNFGDMGSLKFAVDDILDTDSWRISAFSPQNNIDTYFKYNFHNRYVRLTFSRSFGNGKLTSVKSKSASEEERRRVQN